MFGKTITLFRILGFSVRIDLSWPVILVLVVWSLSAGVFPAEIKGLGWGTYWTMGIFAALGLFASVVFHELCHSLMARRYGMEMKGITLFIFGGVAEMGEEPPGPTAEFWMAIAGPLASFLVAGVFIGLSVLARLFGWPATVVSVLGWIGFINGILAVFNLIPGFPLDGGRVLRAILWYFKRNLRWATRVASQVGGAFGLVLIGLGIYNVLTANVIGGIWWILIGMFLRGAARQSYQQVLLREAFRGEPVSRFMNTQPVTVPESASLDELVKDYLYKHHFKMFPVVADHDDGRLAGCVTVKQVKEVPHDQWPQRHVGDIVTPCSEENTISPDEDAMTALSRMSQLHASRMMVVKDGRLAGILTLKDLLGFLSMKLELESSGQGAPGGGMGSPPDAGPAPGAGSPSS